MNPATENDEPYYRIKESYRDKLGRVHSLVLLSPGFIKGYSGKALVVIDAGISSEDNLALIEEKGFHYLCVSRKNLTEYELADDARTVTVLDSRKQPTQAAAIYDKLGFRHYPFRKMKICSAQT